MTFLESLDMLSICLHLCFSCIGHSLSMRGVLQSVSEILCSRGHLLLCVDEKMSNAYSQDLYNSYWFCQCNPSGNFVEPIETGSAFNTDQAWNRLE